jgi:acyl-CoA synthetase (AMP-forming)/AMP-acid ligase II
MLSQKNFGDMLHQSAKYKKDNVILIDKRNSVESSGLVLDFYIDYFEIQLGKVLKSTDKLFITILAQNNIEYLALWIALQKLEITVAELLPEWPPTIINKAAKYINAPYIISDRLLSPELSSGHDIVWSQGQWTVWRNKNVNLLTSSGTPISNLAFTSGTDGNLKAAMISPEGILHVVKEINFYMGNTPEDIMSTSLPWQHGYGKSVILCAILAGAKALIIKDSLFIKDSLECLNSEQATSYSAVPVQIRKWIKTKESPHLLSLRVVCIAGGSLNIHELQELKTLLSPSCRIIPMYGMTEMSPRVAFLDLNTFEHKIGSAGKPIAGVRIRIDGNEEGEIQVKGPNLMLGYWNLPRESADALTPDGWLKTGDWGKIDQEGFLWINGRTKDVIKRSGSFIYALAIEELCSTEFNLCSTAIGFHETESEDKLLLFIEALKTEVDQHKIRIKILKTLGPSYNPDDIFLVEKIPRTVTGKVMRSELIKLAMTKDNSWK